MLSRLAVSVAGGVAFGVAFGVAGGVAVGVAGGVAGGVAVGVAFGVAGGVAVGVAGGVAVGVAVGVAGGVAVGVAGGVAVGVAGGVAGGVGALRVPFWLIHLIRVYNPWQRRKRHPLITDELNVLPLPGSSRYLFTQLNTDPEQGLQLCTQVLSNPFQAWAVHNAIYRHLHQTQHPLQTLYNWLKPEFLECYVSFPIDRQEQRDFVTVKQSLLSELAGVPINHEGKAGFFRTLPYSLTYPLRKIPQSPLRDLIQLFHHLLFDDNQSPISHLENSPNFTELTTYPHGSEVSASFQTFLAYLKFQTSADIATAPQHLPQHLTWLNPTDTFLRPTVIQALHTLSTLSQEVHRANILSSKVTQRNAILNANNQLETLKTTVTQTIHPNYPEQKLLLRIIDQWQTIITKVGGELANAPLLEPVANPYVVGPPVTGSLFVGREDILTTLEELWNKPGQLESVVIYGHRRMGKTSILRNLPGRFDPHTHIINFNIQTLGTLQTTADLILALAQTLYDDLPTHIQPHLPEPQPTDFPTPEKDFRRWLKKLDQYRQKDRFIIAIDEFELIETGIREQRFDTSLIGHWRGILMDFPWIIFAFAGLHTLQEMTQDYWNPLFGSVRKIPVSFLSPAAARKLITNPNDDFPIDYTPEAVDQIYHLSGGQPYLIQLICQNLVSRFNQLRFEQNQEIEPLFTEDDVYEVINHPHFFQEGSAYFRAIWEQAQETDAATQLAILRHLTHDPATATQLQTALDLDPQHLTIGLKLLLDHDIIQLNPDDRYQYRVELMRTWVAQTQLA
ncbi:ATP-binding protein [Alkalinema sp. FACHB-956]|uniref:AAA family ATPase n=1 Tax=Alkalinema sp. FACHB-956 TaxID=2692768 RepID=UPI0016825824|nr:ATP-binding protein [Alkalinema sp. FACHB-956]MBD2326715.1 AAA family ATPase [Alkalinema sp. FACHB-956]